MLLKNAAWSPVFTTTVHRRSGEAMALPKMVFSFLKTIILMPRLKPIRVFPVIFIPQKVLRMPYLSPIFRLPLRLPLPHPLMNANMFRTLMKRSSELNLKAGSSCTAFHRTAGKKQFPPLNPEAGGRQRPPASLFLLYSQFSVTVLLFFVLSPFPVSQKKNHNYQARNQQGCQCL